MNVTVAFPDHDASVVAEIARTPHERAVGLSGRTSLPANRGMLFVFDAPGDHRFTMRNTLINLDMIFMNERGIVVGIVESAKPETPALAVGTASLYVLEVPGLWARVHGVQVGDRAVF